VIVCQIISRFVWLLNDDVVRDVQVMTLPGESKSETAVATTDSLMFQTTRKNFGSRISCRADKLHSNGTNVFDKSIVSSTFIDFKMSPVVLETLTKSNNISVLVESNPTPGRVTVRGGPEDKLMAELFCSDVADLCIEGAESTGGGGGIAVVANMTTTSGALSKFDIYLTNVTKEGTVVTIAFENVLGVAVAGPVTLVPPDLVDNEDGDDWAQRAAGKESSVLLASLVAFPVVAALVGVVLIVYFRTPGSSIFKCGEYQVANDIWETEV
jgi:hypothetical protein